MNTQEEMTKGAIQFFLLSVLFHKSSDKQSPSPSQKSNLSLIFLASNKTKDALCLPTEPLTWPATMPSLLGAETEKGRISAQKRCF